MVDDDAPSPEDSAPHDPQDLEASGQAADSKGRPAADREPPTGKPGPKTVRLSTVLVSLATAVGFLSAVVQIVVTPTRPVFLAIVISGVVVILGALGWLIFGARDEGWFKKVMIGGQSLILALLLGITSALLGYDAGQRRGVSEGEAQAATSAFNAGYTTGRQDTVPKTLFVAYVSTNERDQQLGPPIALAPIGETPANEYKGKVELGYAYSPDSSDIPGTVLIYDLFCTGKGDERPCAGARRAHLFSRNKLVDTPWAQEPNQALPVARFFVSGPDGSCGPSRVALYRYEGVSPAGAALYEIGSVSYPTQLKRTELLGCVDPAR